MIRALHAISKTTQGSCYSDLRRPSFRAIMNLLFVSSTMGTSVGVLTGG